MVTRLTLCYSSAMNNRKNANPPRVRRDSEGQRLVVSRKNPKKDAKPSEVKHG